jgi:hypothetical protein
MAALVLALQAAKSQQIALPPTLIIGTTTIKLGMPKATVTAALASQYVVKQSQNCNDEPQSTMSRLHRLPH